jgi:hypothetical protein
VLPSVDVSAGKEQTTMPGGRLRTFRLGDRTELMAELVLNTIAFTSRVPRQEDIGHDFVCALSELRDGFYRAGPSFTVQVKSNLEPLVFAKRHEIQWIKGQENPFLIAVGDRDELKLDIYSTWNRLNGFLFKHAEKIVFNFKAAPSGGSSVHTEDDGSEQIIYLEKPVVSTTVKQMMDEAHASTVTRVLKQWIELDRENIVNNHAGVHWVIGPAAYETNALFGPETTWMCWQFWNRENLAKCEKNFGRAATELRLTLNAALTKSPERSGEYQDRISALEEVLRSYSMCLEPLSRKALEQHARMRFDSGLGTT